MDSRDFMDEMLDWEARRTPEQESEAEARAAQQSAEYDEACKRMIAWLADLPSDTEIGWNSHHVSPARPFALGWIDVSVPMLEHEAGWYWSWTIERPWYEPGPDSDLFSLAAEFDCLIELHPDGTEPGGEDWSNLNPAVDGIRLRCPNGRLHRYTLEDDTPDYWLSMRAAGIETVIDGETWLVAPAFSPASVSRALAGWIEQQTGRADIHFRWEPLIPPPAHVQEAIALAADWKDRNGRDLDDDPVRDRTPVSVCSFGPEVLPAAEVSRLIAEVSPEVLRQEREFDADLARRVVAYEAEIEARRRELRG